MEKYSVFDCTMVELDKHHSDRKGNITVVENGKTLPFDVIFFIALSPMDRGSQHGAITTLLRTSSKEQPKINSLNSSKVYL